MRTLVQVGDRTLLHNRLIVVGPLAWLAWATQGKNMQRGLAAESKALAARAEQLHRSGG